MAFPSISQLSREYVRVAVRARRSGAAYDPTGDLVDFAITLKPDTTTTSDPYNEPESGDWAAGTWETEGSKYLAAITVGPGGSLVPPEAGIYQVWVRVTASPEVPVFYAGDLEVF